MASNNKSLPDNHKSPAQPGALRGNLIKWAARCLIPRLAIVLRRVCSVAIFVALCEPRFDAGHLRVFSVRSAKSRANRCRPALIRHAFEALNDGQPILRH